MVRNIFIALSFVCIGALGYFSLRTPSEKNGYIINQDLFNGFEGKKMLEEKLHSLRARHEHWLDSVRQLAESGNNSPNLVSAYQRNVEAFSLEEKEVLDKYNADIWQKLNQYVADYGKEKGYSYIFGALGDGSLMYADSSENLTKDIIQYANDRYRKGD